MRASWPTFGPTSTTPSRRSSRTELGGTSVTSDFPPQFVPVVVSSLPANPHIKYFEGLGHGYVRCDITPSRWQADFRFVESVLDPQSPVFTAASFVIEDGVPGALPD